MATREKNNENGHKHHGSAHEHRGERPDGGRGRNEGCKTFAERDPLAAEEPTVLESSASDPEFPALQEFEVDEGGPAGSQAKHPGVLWGIIAVVAVLILCFAFAIAGDWMAPNQAEQTAQTEFEEQTVPEDLGANENPEAAIEHD